MAKMELTIEKTKKNAHEAISQLKSLIEQMNYKSVLHETHMRESEENIEKSFQEILKTVEDRKKELLTQVSDWMSTTGKEITSTTYEYQQSLLYLSAKSSILEDIQTSAPLYSLSIEHLNLTSLLSDIEREIIKIKNQYVVLEPTKLKVIVDISDTKQSINKCGVLLEPSASCSSYTLLFVNDHFELSLMIKTKDYQPYPHGDLSISAWIDVNDPESKHKDDTKASDSASVGAEAPTASKKLKTNNIVIVNEKNQISHERTEITYTKEKKYFIKIIPYEICPHSQIRVALNKKLMHIDNSCNMCYMLNQRDINLLMTNLQQSGDTIYTLENQTMSLLYIRDNHASLESYKLYDMISSHVSVVTAVCFYDNYIYVLSQEDECIYIFAPDGTQSLLSNDLNSYSKKIFDQPSAFAVHRIQHQRKIIVHINKNAEAYKVVLHDEDTQTVLGFISNSEIGLDNIKLKVGKYIERDDSQKKAKHSVDIIRIFGYNCYNTSKCMKYFTFNGKLEKTIFLISDVNDIFYTPNNIILLCASRIVIYNSQFHLLCTILSSHVYDIIRVDNYKLYAISNRSKLLTIWDTNIE